jgi:hypothetical protein
MTSMSTKIEIVKADITKMSVDAIVNDQHFPIRWRWR